MLWRKQAREQRLRAANRLSIAGMVLLVPAMVGVVFVVTDMIFESVLACVSCDRRRDDLLRLRVVRATAAVPLGAKLTGRPYPTSS